MLVLCWQASVSWFGVSEYVLPPPLETFQALWTNVTSGRYVDDFVFTLRNILAGFGIGTLTGLIVGSVMSMSELLERVLHPYITAFQSFPKVALIPFLTLLLGFDAAPKITIAAIISFLPVMVNTLSGLKAVDNESEELMKSLRASRTQTYFKLRLPAALPYIFAGVELALVLATLAEVTAEFLGSTMGLGFLVQNFSSQLATADAFSLLFIFGLLGASSYYAVALFRKRFVYWQ